MKKISGGINRIMTITMKDRKKKLREGEIIPLTFDHAFKLMWGNENHPEVTALLISKLLNIPYKEVEGKIRFTNSKNQNLSVGDKQSDKDVTFVVDTTEPYKISLEMNFSPNALIHNNIIERNLYYLSNFFGTGLGQRSYRDLKTTIQFNFNMDFIDKENKKLIDIYKCRNEEGHVLTEILQIVHINIAEMYDIWYNRPEEMAKYDKNMQDIIRLCACMVTKLQAEFDKALNEVDADNLLKCNMKEIMSNMVNDEELCVLFYDREEEQRKIWDSIRAEVLEDARNGIIKPPLLKELKEDLREEVKNEVRVEIKEEVIEETKKEIREEIKEEVIEETKKEIREEVKEEERKEIKEETKKEMILSMKEEGLNLETISKITKLSIEEIEKILKE